MDARIFTEPQEGATYDQLLAVARAAEAAGFSAFFRSDHYLKIFSADPGPGSTDAWVTLGALARETDTIRLGTLVTPATFRLPGPLAISVAQVDEMSGGRVELGLGTGWYDTEHAAYGIPFPPLGQRFEALEEQLEIIHGLWSTAPGHTFSFSGSHYSLTDSPALPRPVQNPHPPVVIGGYGPKRTARLAATYADEYNVPFPQIDGYAGPLRAVREACQALGRDPDELVYSVAQTVVCGNSDAEVARRCEAIGRAPEELAQSGLCGSPAQILDKVGQFGELGAERMYFQVLDLDDLGHIDLLGSEVVAKL